MMHDRMRCAQREVVIIRVTCVYEQIKFESASCLAYTVNVYIVAEISPQLDQRIACRIGTPPALIRDWKFYCQWLSSVLQPWERRAHFKQVLWLVCHKNRTCSLQT